jgi:MoxR-like ATPase
MSPMSAEATVVRNYIETLVGLPWKKKSRISKDLAAAEKILDKDHYGLEKVKERIVEYLAVQQRVDKVKAPILCLVGPPGVGKTSLGQSIARATNRKFIRMALGGVRDEAEIRGHRRTYIGSMPGKILQNMSKVGVKNPLFLLDEVDKLGRISAATRLRPAEVLDPEQNHTFQDHYIEVDFDLSDVMFVATANSLNIPAALLDRLEVIRLAGYTEDEKGQYRQRYLLPKQMKNNGIKRDELGVTEDALRDIVRYYTREAGVRALEREISKICRKVVKALVMKARKNKIVVNSKNLDKFLGVRRYSFGMAEKENQVGQVTGLAWTEVGGELLTIETVALPGKGKTMTTGKLGEVMQESIQAALSVVRKRSKALGIADDFYQNNDIHIHLPEGATPKDGPSAGIAICTALVSVLTGIPVRADVAMTGEITLRGEVLPIGGLKEKAAGGGAWRHSPGADPGRKRQGSGRNSGHHQEPHRNPAGPLDRQGIGIGTGAHARALARNSRDSCGSGGRRGCGNSRGGNPLSVELLKSRSGCLMGQPPFIGCLAQLVERRPYKANVGGSTPSAPTKEQRRTRFAFFLQGTRRMSMFDIVRNNKKITQVFLAVITLPFAFWGVESYVRNVDSGNEVATVGTAKISQQELQAAIREQQDKLRAQLGGKLDPVVFDSPEMRRAMLDSLITQRLLAEQARTAKMSVGDAQLAQFIASVPSLAGERQVFQGAVRGAGRQPGHEQGNVRGQVASGSGHAATGLAGQRSRHLRGRCSRALADHPA